MDTNNGPPRRSKIAVETSKDPLLSGNPYQLGWAAGFLDGEGCIHIAKQRYLAARSDTYRLGVSLTQNDLDVLAHFRDVIGIDVPIFKVKLAPNHRRQCYTLNYSGKGALKLISMLSPHLRRKRLEAQAASDFWTEGRVGQHGGRKALDPEVVATRERFYLLLKQLK